VKLLLARGYTFGMARIGLQLYTLRDEIRHDFAGVVRAVAAMGYEGIETSGIFGEPSPELKSLLSETGLAVAGLGFDLNRLEQEPQAVIDTCRALDCPHAITFWIDESLRRDADDWMRLAERFNRIGERLAQGGVNYLLHLHGYEFGSYSGKTAIEILMEQTDPRYFNLEPDTYWVEYGGEDAARFCERYADRIRAIHLKDYISKPEMHDIEVGEGAIDMRTILRLALQHNWRWLIVEQERYIRPPIESARRCYTNLRRMLESLS